MLLQGKKGLIFGVANNRSIAWGIAQACHAEGATLGFTFLNEALERRVVPLAESLGSEFIVQCNAQNDVELDSVFSKIETQWGALDFIVHSIAYANADDLKARFHETSRGGFQLALDVSCYSLIALAQRAVRLMSPGGAILTLSYLGATHVVQNYKVMGVAKAALEATVRELAADLGMGGIRVNAISAGPIKTLAASGISGFRNLLASFEERAPLRKTATIEDVGLSAVYLLSDMSRAVTGEVHFVDCGFNITAI